MLKHLSVLFTLFFTFTLSAQFDWEHTYGPEGALYYDMASTDQYVFKATKYAVFRTQNGESWERFDHPGLLRLTQQQNDLYAVQTQNGPHRIEWSNDQGMSWSAVPLPSTTYDTWSLAADETYVYANPVQYTNQNAQLYRTANQGQNWESLDLPLSQSYNMYIADDKMYIYNLDQLFFSTDHGESWTTYPLPAFDIGIHDMAARGDSIVLLDYISVVYSHDGGQNWAEHYPYEEMQRIYLLESGLYMTHTIHGLDRSDDFGASWVDVVEESEASVYRFSDLEERNDMLFINSHSKGVVRLDLNTEELTLVNEGLSAGLVNDLENGADQIWAATSLGVAAYDPVTAVWTQHTIFPLQANGYEMLAVGDDGLICVLPKVFSGRAQISQDYGNTWQESLINPAVTAYKIDWLEIIGTTILAQAKFDQKVWRSSDQGSSWEVVYEGDVFQQPRITVHNNELWLTSGTELFRSTDLGTSWELVFTFDTPVSDIYAAQDYLMAVQHLPTGDVAYLSEDGINWQFASTGLPQFISCRFDDLEVCKNEFFYGAGHYYMHLDEFGLFVSENEGATWLPISYDRNVTYMVRDDIFYQGAIQEGVRKSGAPTIYGQQLAGTVYIDQNNNGIFDPDEPTLPGVAVNVHREDGLWPFYFTSTDADGQYRVSVPGFQTDTIRIRSPFPYTEQINPPFYLGDTGGEDLNFGIRLTENITDLTLTGSATMSRPGFSQTIGLFFQNIGSVETSATVSLRLDDYFTYSEAIPAPTAIYGDSIVWDISNLPILETDRITVHGTISPSTPLDAEVVHLARISSPQADATPEDNLAIITNITQGAFDPNDKRVQPAEGLTADQIEAGEAVTYTIRFQNTGNLPAERVRITDQLDTALNWASLRLLGTSHDITSFNLHPGGLLEIIFDDIQLPDSLSNEPASHGYVSFSIQRNIHYNSFAKVYNKAAIFFDFNEPIITNEVVFGLAEVMVSVSHPEAEAAEELWIYPNPTTGTFWVDTRGQLSGSGQIVIYDALGRLVLRQMMEQLEQSQRIENTALPSGLYHIQVWNEQGRRSASLIIQRP